MISFDIADAADQKFSTVSNNRRVTIRLRFNYVSDRWTFDLAIDGDYVLHGRRIVPNIDLIEPFGFGLGVIFAYSFNGDKPSRQQLVNGLVRLYQASRQEVQNVVALA